MARGPGFVRIGAAVAGCALVAACTPDPAPPATPTPTTSSAAVTPTPSASSTETDIERQQRLDWEAAEAAYRRAVSESDRLAREGAAKPSPGLTNVATGAYLKLSVDSLKELKANSWRFTGKVTIVAVKHQGGWQSRQLRLMSCEDNSTWHIFNKKGKDVTPADQPDYIQSLVVVKSAKLWKVSTVSTKKVSRVTQEDCA